MSIKARWSSVDVEIDDADPFADEAEPLHIPTVGLPIDVHSPADLLSERFTRTIEVEGALEARGTACAIKQIPDTTCLACPLYSGDESDDQALLCRLGREQDTLITLLALRKHGEGR